MGNEGIKAGNLESLRLSGTRNLEQTTYITYFRNCIDNFKRGFRENLEIYNGDDFSDKMAKPLLILCSPFALAHAFLFPNLYKKEYQDKL